MSTKPYQKFAIMLAFSFCIMYVVMFLNVSSLEHIYISLNRAYMALLMVSPMALLMLRMMGNMYPDKKKNRLIALGSTAVLIGSFICLRTQAFVDDAQYMRGMIPHHSSAILTSRHANIKDPQVRKLADDIIDTQEREIAEMKAYLARLEK